MPSFILPKCSLSETIKNVANTTLKCEIYLKKLKRIPGSNFLTLIKGSKLPVDPRWMHVVWSPRTDMHYCIKLLNITGAKYWCVSVAGTIQPCVSFYWNKIFHYIENEYSLPFSIPSTSSTCYMWCFWIHIWPYLEMYNFYPEKDSVFLLRATWCEIDCGHICQKL